MALVNKMLELMNIKSIVLIISLILIVGCSSFFEIPEYGQEQYLVGKYSNLISAIDECIKSSDSFFSLAAKLEKVQYPENFLYVGLNKSNAKWTDEADDVIKKYNWKSHSITSHNFYGYGTLDEKKISVIIFEIKNIENLKNCIVYLEYTEKT